MIIRKITDRYPMDLLYLADPSSEAVADYLARGECWGAYEAGLIVGEYVLLPTRPFTAEIVNVAVDEEHQGKGIGKKLVNHAIDTARRAGYKKLEIGTATIGTMQIALYKKCGFAEEWIDRNFFVKHYNGPVIDDGEECVDMIRLGMDL